MSLDTEVLVVGGGPVGLTLGIDLSHRGRSSIVLETRKDATQHPKATLLGARSMEIYRRWGLTDAIFDAALPADINYWIIFCTRLAGHELARFASPSINEVRDRPEGSEEKWRELQWSPYGKTQIGQQALEPILIDAARAAPHTDLRHGQRHLSFEDRGDHVVSTVEDVDTGATHEITSRYLVGCDGGGSRVRKALGIPFGGRGPWRSNVSLYFRAPDFLETHGKGVGNLYFVFAPDAFGVFTGINGRDLWNYQLYFLDPAKETREIDAEAVLHRAVGKPFEFELLQVTHWQHHQSVAHRWRDGNVFLAGDAAHLFAPTGGVGMNTGIGDACDLSWKLDAVLAGWGGDALLGSYEAERRPVAWRNSQRSMTNSDTIDFVMGQVTNHIEDATPGGEAARARLTENVRWMARQFNSAGAHIGHRYAASPITVPDGSIEPPDDFARVVQSTWPGSRAPHVWLSKGVSTLDWYGASHVLVVLDEGCGSDAKAMLSALRTAEVPCTLQSCDHAEVRAAYETPMVLVRPDGHVAWRGADKPDDLTAWVARLTGHAATV
ncbi:FAD-dependent monooxygenase [Pseudaestuariivita sp.]|uniref:FAD-dependent monooxygenase n=1 Tax=Pseudaestuariivita sp. TaxID=2211669 RepID=UPI0040580C9B